MRILIATVGSRGDVQPYVALGKGLRAAGHTVTVCTSDVYRPFVTEHGLDHAFMNNDLVELLESDEGRRAIENMRTPWGVLKTMRRLLPKIGSTQRAMLAEGWDAARAFRPDVIVYHPKAAGGAHYAEKLDVRAMLALPFPQLVPTAEFPSVGFPDWKLGRTYRRSTYRLVHAIGKRVVRRYVGEWRQAHGLPRLPRSRDILLDHAGRPIPVLHGFSRHVCPRPADWPDSAVTTGYWFLDRGNDWQPSDELQRFLAAGEPPIYVGFGSMSGRNPERVTGIVIGALRQARRRGILATGWGGLRAERLPDTILKIDAAPHDWLFPRMAAVVHHGGAGTTGAGLRAGRPTVVCPFFGDQPFWGRRVRDLGAGPAPIPQRKLTVRRLGDALVEATTRPDFRRNAEGIAAKVGAEDGIAAAVRFIESWRSPSRS